MKSELSKRVTPPDTSELETIFTNIVEGHNKKILQKTDICIIDPNNHMDITLEVSCHYSQFTQFLQRFKPGAWGSLPEDYK